MSRAHSRAQHVRAPVRVGRYAIYDAIGAGGMASVHLARLSGPRGFGKTVAVKRLHAELAKDPEAVAAFVDEAQLMSRIRHPNVVSVLDVVSEAGELYLVMEYVSGVSLATLLRNARLLGKKIPPAIASAIVSAALGGLGAAHEAKDEAGRPLELVHRDVSPQNVLVGADGIARVLDFGIAKAAMRSSATRNGVQKGKPGYMAPEQLLDQPVDARADVWGAAVVLWELVTGSRLFGGESDWAISRKVLERPIDPPSRIRPDLPEALDAVVLDGLARDRDRRHPSAVAMAAALERAVAPASAAEVARFVRELAGDELTRLASAVSNVESAAHVSDQKPRRSPRVWLAAAVIGLAAIAVAVISASRARAPEAPSVRSEPTASTTSAASAPSTPAEDTTAFGSPRPPESALVAASAAPSGKERPPLRRAPSASAKPAAPSAPDCDPPYVVDSEGYHRMKPECLGR